MASRINTLRELQLQLQVLSLGTFISQPLLGRFDSEAGKELLASRRSVIAAAVRNARSRKGTTTGANAAFSSNGQMDFSSDPRHPEKALRPTERRCRERVMAPS